MTKKPTIKVDKFDDMTFQRAMMKTSIARLKSLQERAEKLTDLKARKVALESTKIYEKSAREIQKARKFDRKMVDDVKMGVLQLEVIVSEFQFGKLSAEAKKAQKAVDSEMEDQHLRDHMDSEK